MNHILFEVANEAKTSFEDVYCAPDPRAYFSALGACRYDIPARAKPVFMALINALRETRGQDQLTVLDLGCSYGINGALLKHHLSLDALYDHYANADGADRGALIERDRLLIEDAPTDDALTVVGLDASPQAVRYASDAGLIDAGVAANLEAAPPSAAAAPLIAPADIVISTGCVGYVTENTFDRILTLTDAAPGPNPWIASFVLRMFPYDQIAQTLAERGLVTEKLDGVTFVQRRFADKTERDEVLGRLLALGIDPTDREATGCFHAELFVSRPAGEAAAQALPTLIPPEALALAA